MTTLSKARQALDRAFDRIFPKHPIHLPPRLRDLLRQNPLRIADVGGAMGPEARWKALGLELCKFVTFEPDARSFDGLAIDPSGRNATLAVGLSGTPGDRTLHLTQGAFASSLYPPNPAVLKDFAVWPWHETAGVATIRVDTLDNCLARHPEWRPDFIKVDVEGADRDVLKGASGCLPDVLGVQVEVAFVERNTGAPLQPDIDRWLRAAGFVPHQLIREHWVRNNGAFGATSRPQLIWADALYLRPRRQILDRLARTAADDRPALLARVLAMLLAYGAHDYALELVEAATSAGLLDQPVAEDARRAVAGSVVGTPAFVLRGSVALLLALAGWIILLPLGGRGRAVGRSIVARQAAPLFHALYRAASRGGLQASCISDLP